MEVEQLLEFAQRAQFGRQREVGVNELADPLGCIAAVEFRDARAIQRQRGARWPPRHPQSIRTEASL